METFKIIKIHFRAILYFKLNEDLLKLTLYFLSKI